MQRNRWRVREKEDIMPGFTQILTMVEDLEQRLTRLKDELGRLQAQANIDDAEAGSHAVTHTYAKVLPPTSAEIEILGGAETEQFPDCCAVGDDTRYYCSGTLIASRLVVTADHCEDIPHGYHITRVFLKGNDIYQPNEGEIIRVVQQFSHQEVDLRVLLLEEDATVVPRPIAPAAIAASSTSATLVGFGNIDREGSFGYGHKRMVNVPITTLDCREVGYSKRYGCLPGREIVAGHRGLDMDTCTGDSGGPL
jgi:secreted trypsin-like serine protease